MTTTPNLPRLRHFVEQLAALLERHSDEPEILKQGAALLGELVAQLTGVHHFDLGAAVTFYFNPAQVFVFDAQGLLLQAPVRGKGR